MTKSTRSDNQYHLTQAEQRYLNLLRQMQDKANASQRPYALTVVVTNSSVSFFDGAPSGTNSAKPSIDKT